MIARCGTCGIAVIGARAGDVFVRCAVCPAPYAGHLQRKREARLRRKMERAERKALAAAERLARARGPLLRCTLHPDVEPFATVRGCSSCAKTLLAELRREQPDNSFLARLAEEVSID